MFSVPSSSLMLASLSREYRLMLRSARPGLGAEDEDDLQSLLRAGINWDVFIRLLQWHRLVPQAFATLRRLGLDALPPHVRDALQAHVQYSTQRNLALTVELVRLVQQLRDHGTQMLPLKGPTLAVYVYGNLALRHDGDLDILVPRQALRQAIQVLQVLGYACLQERHGAFNIAQEAIYLRYNNELSFWCEARRIHVDLHWDFDRTWQRFSTTTDALWNRLTALELAGTSVPCLADEDLLLYLCVHGSKHCWERLCWLCDIAVLVYRRPGLDWQRLLLQAAAWDNLRPLLHGLGLAQGLFGSVLPPHIQERVQNNPIVARLTTTVYRTLARPVDVSSPPRRLSTILQRLRYIRRLRASLRYKLAVYANVLSPAYVTDWQALPLPAMLFPLYYVIRPLRLLGKRLMWRR